MFNWIPSHYYWVNILKHDPNLVVDEGWHFRSHLKTNYVLMKANYIPENWNNLGEERSHNVASLVMSIPVIVHVASTSWQPRLSHHNFTLPTAWKGRAFHSYRFFVHVKERNNWQLLSLVVTTRVCSICQSAWLSSGARGIVGMKWVEPWHDKKGKVSGNLWQPRNEIFGVLLA